MPSWSSPWRSMRKKRDRASGSGRPSSTIAATSCSAMPQPAEPAPRIATVWSRSGRPVTATAASRAPVVTAAVPWMSSLKVQSWSR